MTVYVIAEAGVNHNGDLGRALELVDAAAAAGANAVKFQTFRADAIATAQAPKAEYQRTRTDERESQREMLRALELDEAAHRRIVARCAERGIDFLSTPFDEGSLRLLVDGLKLDTIKIGSGDLTNAPLLHGVARAGRRVLLSTGMATLEEVRDALGVLAHGYTGAPSPSRAAFAAAYDSAGGQAALAAKVILLHCTTDYPAKYEEINLRAMATMRETFGLPVGLSDHSPGISVAVAAAALGASVIEKHLTLDRTLPGPDHAASLEPDAFADLVRSIRDVESALGDGLKRPMPSEAKNRTAARKSLVAARPIRRGERFDASNLTVKRPGDGISAMDYWDRIGQVAARDYAADEAIAP